MRHLPRTFYARPASEVATDLLGKILVHKTPAGRLSGRIVEVEAYEGETDPGSHAFRGRTDRNHVMFGPPGYVYTYLSYGAHTCMNVVTDSASIASAVLIRALEPLEGIPVMQRNRGHTALSALCSGPGKLCQALGITMADYGADLEGHVLWIGDDGLRPHAVEVTTRVGLTRGADLPLRFLVPGSAHLSRHPGRAGATVWVGEGPPTRPL